MRSNAKSWSHQYWGVLLLSDGKEPILISGSWHPKIKYTYEGEPSRPVLFTTRKLARIWCKELNEMCKHVSIWKFKVVKVKYNVKAI